jgi:uncharacterized protein (DUF302 family)
MTTQPSQPSASPALPGTVVTPTRYGFDELVQRLEDAVHGHGMLLIAKPSASRNAAARGIEIPGNAVLLTFNNDFAVRLLRISVAAGFEAPMRLYVTESADHTATVTHRTAAAAFAPYATAELDLLAGDIDQVLARIVADAAAAR